VDARQSFIVLPVLPGPNSFVDGSAIEMGKWVSCKTHGHGTGRKEWNVEPASDLPYAIMLEER